MVANRRFLFACFLGLVVLLAGGVGVGGAQAGEQKARAFIESLAEKAVKALTVPDITRDERERRFRVLLHEHFAVSVIGRWVLGRHWRSASPEQREEYLELFEDLIVATYVDRFTKYSGESLSVIKSLTHGKNDVLVFSKIIRPTGAADRMQ